MIEPRKPALLGLTAYLITGLTIGITHLLAHGILGLNPVADAVDSPVVDAIRDGSAFPVVMFAFLLMLPLLTVAVAALMGRHGGRTQQPAAGAAAVTTVIGVPLVWVNFAIATLLVGAILGAQGLDDAFAQSVDALVASLVQVLLVLGPLVAVAALVAQRALVWADHTEAAISGHPVEPGYPVEHPEHLGATDPGAWETPPEGETGPEPFVSDTMLHDHPVDCPRCGRAFTVSGERPLRISCPECGKTGTIQ